MRKSSNICHMTFGTNLENTSRIVNSHLNINVYWTSLIWFVILCSSFGLWLLCFLGIYRPDHESVFAKFRDLYAPAAWTNCQSMGALYGEWADFTTGVSGKYKQRTGCYLCIYVAPSLSGGLLLNDSENKLILCQHNFIL